MPVTSQRYEPHADLAALVDHPRNPRRGDDSAVLASVSSNGFYGAIVAQADTGYILAGHTRRRALAASGANTGPVLWVQCDDQTATRILLADNRTAELATWDDKLLAELLNEVPATDLGATGFNEADFADLLLKAAEKPVADPDDAPEPPADPISKPGDIWVLGKHIVICGDSTDEAVVRALLGNERCDCMWTDPPYGVDYQANMSVEEAKIRHRRTDGKVVQNDGAQGLDALLAAWLPVATKALRPGAPTYIAHPAGALSIAFGQAIVDAGWSLRQQLIWAKDQMVLGRTDYHYKHEPIWMSYTPDGSGRLGRGGDNWFGDNTSTSLFEIPRPKRSADHPTMKPVDLITAMTSNSCPPNGLIFDPFGGSGSTLIAAEQTMRRARLIELDPTYVDVICRRYQEFTGDLPTYGDTGEEINFVERA